MFPFPEFGPGQWIAVIFSFILFGISKTGFTGISIIAVPICALIFGAKSSTGIILPLLCFADLIAVLYYRRHAAWKYLWPLIPWAAAGFGLALLADHFIISDRGFKFLMGICIFAGLVVMFWSDGPRFGKKRNAEEVRPAPPDVPAKAAPAKARPFWYSSLFGILGGFSTMIGNTAGPIMSVFLLSVKLPKESFVGTAAWFFLIVNYLKVPLQAFAWHNITKETLYFDVFMIPAIVLGIWLGIVLVKKVSEAQYRVITYVLTLISAVLLFL
ncbi:MAG: sulfite exporter TauE/SafE family protein [Treponema sp.]|jgi:uncharacterized membrane protein YfcA|nr:sulfite exporter TauE/SafE family protein [Treponema sp.]